MRHRLLSLLVLGITFALSAACDRQPTEPNPGSLISGEPGSSPVSDNLPPNLAATGKHVSRYTTNGDFADFFSWDGTRYAYLTVSRYSDGSNSGTSLFYYVYQCSEIQCDVIEAGSGAIPDASLKVTGSGHTTLRVNTAGDFFRWAGSGGDIAIEWEPQRNFESTFKGITDQSYGDVRYHSSGTTTNRSASVSGTLLGQAVPGSGYPSAQVGSSKSKTVLIVAP